MGVQSADNLHGQHTQKKNNGYKIKEKKTGIAYPSGLGAPNLFDQRRLFK